MTFGIHGHERWTRRHTPTQRPEPDGHHPDSLELRFHSNLKQLLKQVSGKDPEEQISFVASNALQPILKDWYRGKWSTPEAGKWIEITEEFLVGYKLNQEAVRKEILNGLATAYPGEGAVQLGKFLQKQGWEIPEGFGVAKE